MSVVNAQFSKNKEKSAFSRKLSIQLSETLKNAQFNILSTRDPKILTICKKIRIFKKSLKNIFLTNVRVTKIRTFWIVNFWIFYKNDYFKWIDNMTVGVVKEWKILRDSRVKITYIIICSVYTKFCILCRKCKEIWFLILLWYFDINSVCVLRLRLWPNSYSTE